MFHRYTFIGKYGYKCMYVYMTYTYMLYMVSYLFAYYNMLMLPYFMCYLWFIIYDYMHYICLILILL